MASILYIHGDTHEVNGLKCSVVRVPAEDVHQLLNAGYVSTVEELYEEAEEQIEEVTEEPEEAEETDDELEELKAQAKELKIPAWHLYTDVDALRAKIEEKLVN